jgi:hypothetical protein
MSSIGPYLEVAAPPVFVNCCRPMVIAMHDEPDPQLMRGWAASMLIGAGLLLRFRPSRR